MCQLASTSELVKSTVVNDQVLTDVAQLDFSKLFTFAF